jgi:hypothetical protein
MLKDRIMVRCLTNSEILSKKIYFDRSLCTCQTLTKCIALSSRKGEEKIEKT